MPRDTTIRRSGIIFIPQDYSKPAYKIQITRNDGTVDTVADSSSPASSALIDLQAKPGLNDVAGTFTLSLDNKDGRFTGNWVGNERIDIWADFSNASTKIFRGRCESIFYELNVSGRTLRIEGRGGLGELQDRTVVRSFETVDGSEIINAVVSDAGTNVTYTASTMNVSMSPKFRDSTAALAVSEVAKKAGHDFYVDSNLALQHFVKNSRTNFNEGAIHGMNLKSLSIGTDARRVKNFVRVYGANVDNTTNVVIVKTASDSASQISHGRKDLVVQDSSLASHDAAQEKADSELSVSKDNPQIGSVYCMGLPSLLPGQLFRVSSPYDNVNGFYKAIDILYRINISEGFTSTIAIEKFPVFSESVVARLNRERSDSASFNVTSPFIDSFVITFSETIPQVTLSNSEILNGRLKITTGSQGTAISKIYKANQKVNEAQIRVSGKDLLVSKFYVSDDAGLNLVLAVPDVQTIAFPSSGDDIQLKIELISDSNNVDPQLEAIGVILK